MAACCSRVCCSRVLLRVCCCRCAALECARFRLCCRSARSSPAPSRVLRSFAVPSVLAGLPPGSLTLPTIAGAVVVRGVVTRSSVVFVAGSVSIEWVVVTATNAGADVVVVRGGAVLVVVVPLDASVDSLWSTVVGVVSLLSPARDTSNAIATPMARKAEHHGAAAHPVAPPRHPRAAPDGGAGVDGRRPPRAGRRPSTTAGRFAIGAVHRRSHRRRRCPRSPRPARRDRGRRCSVDRPWVDRPSVDRPSG